ncbi:MAG: PA0069 family radical SAM protein [Ignavibacteriae bacterium]|nr:PA0069 family radical SAM protein [Ignavibacteria bacterium]MBI3365112.1 PA0069 family radical SAM protein [Ignavibacteriota bacterium]
MLRKSKGRGATFNPPNRFEAFHLEPLDVQSGDDDGRPIQTMFFKDTSKTILAKNDSPDIPFTYSLNPYRGCEHGCIYCYARPSHEYLGFSSGLDFETKILVKHDAPELLEKEFKKKSWQPQMVSLSGNTDCYQPVERKLQLTRRCLEIFLKYRNPVGIITKNALITRDLDILTELARNNLVLTAISMTSLDKELVRKMEPRTSVPHMRLETIEMLTKSGIPVMVNVAPIIPGLNDEEIPAILKEAAARGAVSAGCIMLRLPGPVKPLFCDWLQRELPERAGKVLNRIRDVRGGNLSDPRWGKRMTGEGEIARTINRLFKINRERYGLNKKRFEFNTSLFRREPERQIELFG